MNEENNVKEPIYLTYGSDQIDQQAFLNNAANDLENYLSNQPWSAKRKDLFRKAYVDIMNQGVTGASNTSGQWQITYNGDSINLDSKSKKEREMYGEAAYYIQQQMSKIPTKQNEEKQAEEGKKELPLFDNKFFTSGLQDYIGNNMFGGRNWSTTDDWNILDERGENGLRGTSVRSKKLAEMLQNYSNTLEEGKYNFEGSPFKDLTDFKSRINNAISALNNDDPNDDRDALNAIGLRANDFLYDGSGDVADTEGHTYGQLAQAIQAQNEADAKAKEAQEFTQAEANRKANSGVLNFIGGIHGTDARTNPQAYAEYISKNLGVGQQGFNEMNKAVQGLIEKGYNNGKGGGLTNAEKRQLGNFLYYIRQNNPNVKSGGWKISNQEWAELSKHKNLGSTNRDKYVRLPWQTSDGRYTYADDQGNVYFLKPTNQKKFNTPTFQRSAVYNNYKNNFLKSQLQLNNEKPVLSQDTDILISDMTSMLGDIISLGGGYAGAAGGITTLASDLYGDIRRGKDTWSTLKNLGANIAWGAAGLIPGAKLGRLAKNAARIYATLQSAGILMNDEVQQSWKNLITGKPITAKDFENFKWTLHAITGGTNAARGHFTERNVARQVKSNNKPTIETKSGKKVTLTEEQVKDINKAGGRKGQKAAEEAFKKATGEEAKEGTFSFQENSRAWYNPNRYSQRLRNWTSDNERLVLPKTTQSVNTQNVNKLLEIDKAKPIIGIGNPFNRRFWTEGGPNRGGLTFALAPYRNNSSNSSNNSGNTTNIDENSIRVSEGLNSQQYRQSQVGRTNPAIKNPSELPENVKFNRETINNYKNIINGNFSNNELQSGSYNLTGIPLQVVKQSDGTFSVLFRGNVIANERNQREIQKTIRDVIKNTVQQGKSNNISKISAKEMGILLKEFKAKGWLKRGGTIDKQKIQRYKNYINK